MGEPLKCSNRATHFYNALVRQPNEQTRFRQRLWKAFDGQLPWPVERFLLTFLLSCSTREEVHGRIDDLRDWLREHPDDTNVRENFLAHLSRFPREAAASDRAEAIDWVRKHPQDTNVLTAVFPFLTAHGAVELSEQLGETLVTAGNEIRFFSPGSAALRAASTLPSTCTAVIAGWLTWAGAVLAVYGGQRSAALIADAIPAPAETLRRHLEGDDVPRDARDEALAALLAVTDARTRWQRSVGS